jgi:hypothetical protein
VADGVEDEVDGVEPTLPVTVDVPPPVRPPKPLPPLGDLTMVTVPPPSSVEHATGAIARRVQVTPSNSWVRMGALLRPSYSPVERLYTWAGERPGC